MSEPATMRETLEVIMRCWARAGQMSNTLEKAGYPADADTAIALMLLAAQISEPRPDAPDPDETFVNMARACVQMVRSYEAARAKAQGQDEVNLP